MILKKITSSSLVHGKFVLLHFLPPGNMSYLSYISTNLNFISGTLQDRSSETKEGDGLWDLAPWLHRPLGSPLWELVWEWPAPHERELQSVPILVQTGNKDQAEGAMDPNRLCRHWVLRRWTNVLRPCDEGRDTGGACADPGPSGNVNYNPII